MSTKTFKLSSLLLLTVGLTQFNAVAQTNMPSDFGTVVNGFQDNFTNTTRDPAWVAVNAGNEDVFQQTNGVLRVFAPTNAENPNHLIYMPTNATYDPAVQEVLLRIRVTDYEFTDSGNEDQLAGPALSCQSNATIQPYGGYCMMLADLDGSDVHDSFVGRIQGFQVRLLDDYQAWGPGSAFTWAIGQWYWMRMGSDGSTISAKIWPGDGSVPEPLAYQVSWSDSGRNGFAGITGTHVGPMQFEVDYFLLKSAGLPSITVNPILDQFYLTSDPENTTNAVGTTATFTVSATSPGAISYQWQKSPAGTNAFADIPGATNTTYTTPALALTNNGTQYTVLVSSGGLSDHSSIATVTMDSILPTLIYAKSLGSSNHVTLLFSKPVRVPANASGFSAPGLAFGGVAQGPETDQLVLTSSTMTLGSNYTLTVSGVKDLAGNTITAIGMGIDTSLQMPLEFGTTVNGYQDNFDTGSLNPAWVSSPTDAAVQAQFTQANGMLHFVTDTNVGGYDPEHFLYQPASSYDISNQEVLIRMRINSAVKPDQGIRVGATALADPAGSGRGANVSFFNYDTIGIYARTLVDNQFINTIRTNGNRIFDQFNDWYWMRVKCVNGNSVSVKVWHADGATPEPADFQRTDGFTPSGDTPLWAGILAPSGGAQVSFDVDYFLVKASGLPSINLTAPDAFGFGPFINFTQQPASVVTTPGTPVTLTVAALGSATPTYQWQSAPPGSSTFSDITNQTSTNLTVALSLAQSGTQYRALVSVPGLSLPSAVATIVTAPPTLLFAGTLGNPNGLTLIFDRPVQVPGSVSGFTVQSGVTVSNVAAGAVPSDLVLTTSAFSLSSNYTVTVSGVQDIYGSTLVTTNIAVSLAVELPADYGQSVAGFQDDFSAATMDPNWVPAGLDAQNGYDLFSQTGDGFLHVTSPPSVADSNPNCLLYNGGPYDSSHQEVLMRLRVTAFAPTGGNSAGLDSIGGVTVGNNTLNLPNGGGSGGIDWVLGDSSEQATFTYLAGPQAAFLNDWIAWGTGALYNWTTNEWYWMRLVQDGTNFAAGPNIFAKVWLADGTTPEPAAWQATWSRTNGVGLAGIDAANCNVHTQGSTPPLFNFDVSYFLLKASGLPTITVAPSSFTLIPPLSSLQFTAIQTSGTNVVLQWTGAGTLQQATSPAGPWADMVDPNGAFSPYTIPASAPATFYRMRQ